MNAHRRSPLVGVAASAVLIFAACSGSAGSTASPAATAAAAPSGVASTAAAPSAAVASAAAPSAASSAASSAPVVLQFWSTYNQQDTEASTFANVVIPAFEQQYPGVEVKSVVFPSSGTELLSKLLAAISAGDPPDVVRTDISWVTQLAKLGALQPLSTSLSNWQTLASSVYPGSLSTNLWKGTYYGLPLDTNTQVLFWNKADFQAAGLSGPPQTFSELVTDAQKLTDPAKKQWGLSVDGTDIWNVSPYVWSNGGSFVNAAGTTASGYVKGKATVDALTSLVNMYKAGDIGTDFLGGSGTIGGEQGFPKGQYAMYIDGPWAIPTYQSQFPNLSYGMAPIPAGSGGSISVVGGEDVVVPAGGKHLQAADEFATFLLSPTAQLAMAKAGQMSVVGSVASQETAAVSYYAPFATQLETAKARPPVPQYSQIDTDFSNALQQALHGSMTVQQAMDQVAQQADALLAQNK